MEDNAKVPNGPAWWEKLSLAAQGILAAITATAFLGSFIFSLNMRVSQLEYASVQDRQTIHRIEEDVKELRKTDEERGRILAEIQTNMQWLRAYLQTEGKVTKP